MSSNPLMTGYEGEDLLLPGQRSGRCPGLCVQAVGGGLGGRRLRLVTRARLRWLDRRPSAYTKMRYTNRWPYLFVPVSSPVRVPVLAKL